MNTQHLSSIEQFLKDKIKDRNSFFVFTTDVVCQSWADWCVLDNHTDVKSVASSRFIAWDKFKGAFVSAQKEGYTAIPGILRKLFVQDLIRQNAAEPFFKKIINPDPEYARDAFSFADWIARNLPSLHTWKKRLDQNISTYGTLDEEDEDYLILYKKYSAFLEQHKLFEPAWVDEVKFADSKNQYYIFYPEQLEDFADFTEIFSRSDNVTSLLLPPQTPSPLAHEYTDARSELRHTMLRMIDLVNQKKADWSQIAFSVPDLITYKPYLEREFKLYSIPFVMRAGDSLSKNCAGRIFNEISDCYKNDFSFDSVRTLLLDETLPWKKSLEEKKSALIREGNRMRCITSFNEFKDGTQNKVDPWRRGLFKTEQPELLELYNKLRHHVEQFFKKDMTFADILTAWNQFKGYFLDADDFNSPEFSQSNKILSRCISHLKEIISIETDFILSDSKENSPSLIINSPFKFFTDYLDSKSYTNQQESSGVNIFDYKLTASAYFKYQFIINASQKNLDIQKKRMSFLNLKKRSLLHFTDDDSLINSSAVTAKLYAKPVQDVDQGFVHFSYSIDSFSGFAIPHSSLNVIKNQEAFPEDYIIQEKNWLMEGAKSKITLTPSQLQSLNNWRNSSISCEKPYTFNPELQNKLDYILKESRQDYSQDKADSQNIKISARGDLEQFFPCPRKWILKKILRLKEDSLDTQLMQSYDMGNLNHKILEEFMQTYIQKKLPWFDKDENEFKTDENPQIINSPQISVTKELKTLLYDSITQKAINYINFDFHDSSLVKETLLSQKNLIADTIWNFLKILLLPFNTEEDNKGINGIGNCTVTGLEAKLSAGLQDFDFFGAIDCLVRTPQGQFIILDYKNSSSSIPKTDEINVDDAGILKDFQMTVYAYLVKNHKTVVPQELNAAYFYSLKDGDKTKKRAALDINNSKCNQVLFDQSVSAVIEYAKEFTERVCSSEKDFSPHSSQNPKDRLSVNKYENCAGCNLRTICRTTYNVAGKEINQEEK